MLFSDHGRQGRQSVKIGHSVLHSDLCSGQQTNAPYRAALISPLVIFPQLLMMATSTGVCSNCCLLLVVPKCLITIGEASAAGFCWLPWRRHYYGLFVLNPTRDHLGRVVESRQREISSTYVHPFWCSLRLVLRRHTSSLRVSGICHSETPLSTFVLVGLSRNTTGQTQAPLMMIVHIYAPLCILIAFGERENLSKNHSYLRYVLLIWLLPFKALLKCSTTLMFTPKYLCQGGPIYSDYRNAA